MRSLPAAADDHGSRPHTRDRMVDRAVVVRQPLRSTRPACDACISKLVWQRRGRFVISLLFICVGVFIAHRVLGDFKGINKAITIAITLASCVPWFLWEVFVPRAIELTAFKDTVDYEFADPDFAAEFAELNGVSAD